MESNAGLRKQDLLLMVWQQAERISSTTIHILFDMMKVCFCMDNIKGLCGYEDHCKTKGGKEQDNSVN